MASAAGQRRRTGSSSSASASRSHFERRFELPSEADTEHVEARFGNGVLEVHVPKVQRIGARRIEIAKK